MKSVFEKEGFILMIANKKNRSDKVKEGDSLKLRIGKSENKLVLALIGHLRRILYVVIDRNSWRRKHPLEMDQAELLMCAASLRALIFDDSPAPLLTEFFCKHEVPLEIEAFETDLAMLLFAQVAPTENGHITDFFMEVFFGKEFDGKFPLNVPHKLMGAFGGGSSRYVSLSQRPDVWFPNDGSIPDSVYPVQFIAGEPHQFYTFTRRRVPLDEWGGIVIGYLKGKPIRRRNIISYVANKLGGVHYDPFRLSKKDEKAEFKIIAEAYDWESDAVMHAGLVVVALACIELSNNPILTSLLFACENFENERVAQLLRKGV